MRRISMFVMLWLVAAFFVPARPALGARRPVPVLFVMFYSVPLAYHANATNVFLDVVGKLPRPWRVVVVDPWLKNQSPVLDEASSDLLRAHWSLGLKLRNGLRQATAPLSEKIVVKALFQMVEEWPSISQRHPDGPKQPRLVIVGDSLPSGKWVELALARLALRGFTTTFLRASTSNAPKAAALRRVPGCTVRKASFATLATEVARVLSASAAPERRFKQQLAAVRKRVRQIWSRACREESIRCVHSGGGRPVFAMLGDCRVRSPVSRKSYTLQCVRIYERDELKRWAERLKAHMEISRPSGLDVGLRPASTHLSGGGSGGVGAGGGRGRRK